jgi:hypothetical protein
MSPPAFKPLAELARQRAAELNLRRFAWLTVAAALDHARSISAARQALDEEIDNPGLRELAKQLLGEIADASQQAGE